MGAGNMQLYTWSGIAFIDVSTSDGLVTTATCTYTYSIMKGLKAIMTTHSEANKTNNNYDFWVKQSEVRPQVRSCRIDSGVMVL